MGEAYCLWYEKFIIDLTEFESDECFEAVISCDECSCFTFVSREVFSHE